MTQRSRLSIVILTKNNDDTIEDTLKSAQWADEILIIDSGSTDNTLQIAKHYNAQIHTQTDWQGFGYQRQWGQKKASGDVIFMLDSDEAFTPELAQSIQTILENGLEPNTVYQCARRNKFIDKYMTSCGWYPDTVRRLYIKTERQYKDQTVHESLDTNNAKIKTLQGDLLHQTCLDYGQFQQKQMQYAQAWATERNHNDKKSGLFSAFTHAFTAFIKNYIFRKGVFDGKHGLLLSLTIAQYTFNKYAMLWALNQKNKSQ
jgi:(heptosyl)LPS beta-1,4-glucosyltransferase